MVEWRGHRSVCTNFRLWPSICGRAWEHYPYVTDGHKSKEGWGYWQESVSLGVSGDPYHHFSVTGVSRLSSTRSQITFHGFIPFHNPFLVPSPLLLLAGEITYAFTHFALQVSVRLGASSPIETRQGSAASRTYPTYRLPLRYPHSTCSGATWWSSCTSATFVWWDLGPACIYSLVGGPDNVRHKGPD